MLYSLFCMHAKPLRGGGGLMGRVWWIVLAAALAVTAAPSSLDAPINLPAAVGPPHSTTLVSTAQLSSAHENYVKDEMAGQHTVSVRRARREAGDRTLVKVKVLLAQEVLNDLFFRVLFFRHVLLGQFNDVSFEVLGPRNEWHDRVVAVSETPNTKVLIAGLKGMLSHDSFVQKVLESSTLASTGQPWTKRIGLIVIDDEDYTDRTHTRSNATGHVGLILRNYYDPVAVGAPGVLYFPLGWRTSDGSFFDKHEHFFSDKYLAQHRQSPHAAVHLHAITPSSQRPIRLFFVGTIREGGRQEMDQAVRALSRGLSADAADPAYLLCTQKADVVMSASNPGTPEKCTDVLLTSTKFLANDLDVTEYYTTLNRTRYGLVPCGVNPESYRLWEVLHAGAIPIVETCGSVAHHPFSALPGALGLLPSVWSWRELPAVIARLEADSQGLDVLQRRIARWFSHSMSRAIRKVTESIYEL